MKFKLSLSERFPKPRGLITRVETRKIYFPANDSFFFLSVSGELTGYLL